MFIFLINFLIHIFFSFLLVYCIGTNLLFFFNFIDWNSIFYLYNIITLLVLSLTVQNPIYLLLIILLCFIFFSFFLFKLSLEFIVYIFLIVYIGALMMLFLFVIMLLDLQTRNKIKKKKNINKSLLFFIFLLITQLCFDNNLYLLISKNFIQIDESTFFPTLFYYANITTNGIYNFKDLYLLNNFLFIILTFLLLITMLGSISLALSIQKRK